VLDLGENAAFSRVVGTHEDRHWSRGDLLPNGSWNTPKLELKFIDHSILLAKGIIAVSRALLLMS
jgi:hypothetical protein